MAWGFVFIALFVLSLDYWWWDDQVRLGWLNLPAWIYYFVLLQLALSAALWSFSRRHWPDESSDSGAPDTHR